MRRFVAFAVRVALGLVVDLAISTGIWVAAIRGKGSTVNEAIQGKVEDGLGLLQGLICIGILVGLGVGVAAGLIAAGKVRK